MLFCFVSNKVLCITCKKKNYCLPYIAHGFSSENLVLDQMIIFSLIFF